MTMTNAVAPKKVGVDFNQIPLNKPLSKQFLNRLKLDELEQLEKVLFDRAVNIFKEIAVLEAGFNHDLFDLKNAERGLFRVEIFDPITERLVFQYECEQRLKDQCFITPGEWFNEIQEKLENLREQKAYLSETYVERTSAKVISRLTEGKNNS